MTDEEAYEFYKNPEHLRVVGPGRRRKADMLTEVKSVRFSARMLAQAEAVAEADGREFGSWIRKLVSFELIRLRREQRPSGIIPGSGRRGEPKALGSSLGTFNSTGGRTFRCGHMTVSGVASASCGICGPLAVIA